MKIVNVILALAFVIISVNSYAQRPNNGQKQSPEQIFKMLDKNNDKKISKEEASKAQRGKLAENFSLFDTNKDGFINKKELTNAFNRRKKNEK
jgi:Ca2+-binding EF-hand superfamily protein